MTGKSGSKRWSCIGLAILVLLPTLGLGGRQSEEYEVKAAFLLNFAKFVEWPSKAFPDSKSPFVIGIVGVDPFGDALPQLIKRQTVQQRPIVIRRFKVAEDFSGCHILFLSRSLAAQTDHVLERMKELPVLTVSEREDFVQRGGVIGFAHADKAVRFDINVQAAAAVDLKVSSKLLAIARVVVK